jgi:proteasome lid subunit RPN8/RPN11
VIRLSARIADKIRAHARSTYPEECCGVLIGTADDVTDCRPLTNAWPEWGRKQRYQTDGRELAALEREFAGKPEGVLGFYHSHPDVPAWPSPFDLERSWPVYLYLILSIREGRTGELRAWRKSETEESFTELSFELTEEEPAGAAVSPS